MAKILRRVLQKLKVATSDKYTEISARELKASDAPHLFQKNKGGIVNLNLLMCILLTYVDAR